jgi:hypothetical protein
LNVKGTTIFNDTVTFNGTATYVLSTNTIYTDNMLEIHTTSTGVNGTWAFDDGKDIGFRFHYYAAGDQNAALVLAHDSHALEWYGTGAESNTGTFTGASYGVFKTGAIVLTSSTSVSSAATGALQVGGGVGVGGGLYVTNNITATNVYGTTAVYDNSNRVLTSVTVTAGTGMSGGGTMNSGPTGSVTLTNNGVVGLSAGTAIAVSGTAGGTFTIGNMGVQTLTGGTGVTVSSSTGTPTVSIGQAVATTSDVQFNKVSTKYLTAVDAGPGWALVQGTWHLDTGASFQATYADLAEYYSADADYEPGTVLVFGGEAELTITAVSSDSRVAGVVTTNPAYVMNASLEGTRACLALQGRIPVKVIGTVRKGDMLTTSNTPGYAIKAMNPIVGTIIGKALENKDDPGIGVIQVAIGRM